MKYKFIFASVVVAVATITFSTLGLSKQEFKNKTMETKTECDSCHQGILSEIRQNVVVIAQDGIVPLFDARHYKCSHCGVITPAYCDPEILIPNK